MYVCGERERGSECERRAVMVIVATALYYYNDRYYSMLLLLLIIIIIKLKKCHTYAYTHHLPME
jgi:hypothetical protein